MKKKFTSARARALARAGGSLLKNHFYAAGKKGMTSATEREWEPAGMSAQSDFAIHPSLFIPSYDRNVSNNRDWPAASLTFGLLSLSLSPSHVEILNR